MNYRIPQSLAEFKALVEVVAEEKKVSTTLAVYQLTDFFFTRAMASPTPPVACERGCSACCYMMVLATPLEWREIETYLRQEPGLQGQLRYKIKQAVAEWRKYKDRHPCLPDPREISLEFAAKPCMFLDESDGSCTIYRVRPLGCRSMTNTKRCTIQDQSGAVACRFIWDSHAFETVLRPQITEFTQPEELTIPLQEWLDRSGLDD